MKNKVIITSDVCRIFHIELPAVQYFTRRRRISHWPFQANISFLRQADFRSVLPHQAFRVFLRDHQGDLRTGLRMVFHDHPAQRTDLRKDPVAAEGNTEGHRAVGCLQGLRNLLLQVFQALAGLRGDQDRSGKYRIRISLVALVDKRKPPRRRSVRESWTGSYSW